MTKELTQPETSNPNNKQYRAVNLKNLLRLLTAIFLFAFCNVLTKAQTNYGCYINSPPHTLRSPGDVRIVNSSSDCVVGETAISWDVFPVGTSPGGVSFDGTNIWVSNTGTTGVNTITKFRASDGVNLGTFSGGPTPLESVFDGTNIWVANLSTNTLTKLRASDGAFVATIPLRASQRPYGLAFDGSSIWVASYPDSSVSRLRLSDGAEIGYTPDVFGAIDVIFDGTDIWVSQNLGGGKLTKIRGSDGAIMNVTTLNAGFPGAIAFDGSNVWVTNGGTQNISKVRGSDGTVVGNFAVGFGASGIAFDGANMWVANEDVVLKYRASDGALLGSFPNSFNGSGQYSNGVVFDGTYVWVANRTANTVTRYRDLGPVQSSTNIDPQAYAGNYRIYNTDTNTLVGAFTGTQALNLAAGNYQFDNSNQVGASAFNFSVNQAGQVTSVSNPNAAEGIGNTLRLKNATININPQAYAGNYNFHSYNIINNGNYTFYRGTHSFTVVPGLRYGIDNGTGRGGAARRSYFYFDVGAGGTISNIDLPAAAYASGSTLVLNNTTLTVEPNNYTGLYNITSYGNAPFVSGRRSFVLIPGMLYGFDNGAGFYEPTFNLDSNGSVDYVDSGFASAVGSVLSLSNVRVHVDPTTYGGNYLLNGQLFSGIQEKVLIPTMRFYVAVNNSYQYAVPTQTAVTPPSVTLNEGSNNYTFNFFVNFDETAPTTNASQNPGANAAGWNNSNVNIVLLASDNMDGSGVREIVYSASGAQTISSMTVSGANANLTITAEGETTVTYFARDNAGNAEATQSITIRIDKTPPVISNTPSNQTAEATGTNGAVVPWNPPTASDALDPNVSVACSPDSGNAFSIGTTAVLCTSIDRAGNTSSASFNVTVRDTTAPAISNMPSNISVVATSAAGAQVSWNSPTATDLVDGNVAVNCSPASGSTFAHGVTTVVCTSRDSRNNSDSKSFAVEVTNAPPTANAGGPYQVGEGGAISLSGAGSDVEGTTLTYEWDLDNNGSFETSGQNPTFSAAGLDGPTSRTVRLRVTDAGGLSAVSAATVNVSNVAPMLNSVSGPVAPQAINTTVNVTLSYSDPAGALDTYTPTVNWGDGAVNNSTSHVYTAAGVYRVRATVSDGDGGTSNEAVYEYVVVYDPNGGFVTGGGWIMSPAGAYTPNPSLTGKATFGFVSKYRNGANQPTGNTEFQFHAGSFNFKSEAYEWLVVAGARAQFKGTGAVNGVSGYSFLLTATDGQVNGGGGVDKFRIKIWNALGVVIYDNVLGASDQINEANPQAIGGGSIVIQSDR